MKRLHLLCLLVVLLCAHAAEASQRFSLPQDSHESAKQPDTLGISKTYDAAGRMLTLKNRSGNTWTFGYNDEGQQQNRQTPMGVADFFSYDAQGRIYTQTEGWYDHRFYTYHAEYERLMKINLYSTTSTSTEEINYTYDINGQLNTTTDNAGTITREYTDDPRHLVKKYQFGTDAFEYLHDANGNQTQLKLPDTKTITYGYDNRDRLETITDWAGRITTLVWDAGSRLVSVTRPNNTVRSHFYDGAGQLTRIEERTSAGRLIQMVKLGLDVVGRAEKRFTVPLPIAVNFPTPNFTYNADNWINEKLHDSDGNMLQVPTVPAPIGQAALGAAPGIKDVTGSTNNATWDHRNRLMSLKLADTSTLAFTYDAENIRLTKTRGSSTTRYIHNAHGITGMSECTIEVLPDNSKRLYVWGGPAGLIYDITIPAGSTTETARYYHGDQVGSTMALTNQAGTVIGRADYTPYGLITLRSGDTNTPFLYNGAYGVMTDSETGLAHMRARYYHPWLARFINADPSGFGGGMNMFVFADGDPIMLLDALGLDAQGIRYRNDNGSINWSGVANLAYQSIAGVPSYVAQNGVNSLKRNFSDPKFVMEAAAGGIGGAALSGFNRAAQAVSRAAPVVNRAANTPMFSSNLGSGGARASTELLNNMRSHGRTITIATEGSEELRFLNAVGAEASVGGAGRTSIILRENPSKVGAMEEFLHGTQERLGIIDRRGIQGAEDHVTDFMERHRRLLGLDH